MSLKIPGCIVHRPSGIFNCLFGRLEYFLSCAEVGGVHFRGRQEYLPHRDITAPTIDFAPHPPTHHHHNVPPQFPTEHPTKCQRKRQQLFQQVHTLYETAAPRLSCTPGIQTWRTPELAYTYTSGMRAHSKTSRYGGSSHWPIATPTPSTEQCTRSLVLVVERH